MSTFTGYTQMLRAEAARRTRRNTLLFWAVVDVASIVFCYIVCTGGGA